MNRKSALTTLMILVLTSCLSFAGDHDGSQKCSARLVAGDWGLTTTGVIILPTGPVPVAAVGRFTQDSAGNMQGDQDRSLGGGFAHETFKGTFVVSADCIAKYNINVYDGSGNLARTSILDAVFVNEGNAARVIFESITLPDGTSLPSVLTIEATRLFSKD